MVYVIKNSMDKAIKIVLLALLTGSCRPSEEPILNKQPQIQELRSPVVFNNDTDYFLLDVNNYQHDSTTRVTLRSVSNSPTLIYQIDQIWVETPTRLRVWIKQRWPIKPGQYSITLSQSANRLAEAMQQIEVRIGRSRLDGFTRVSPSLAGRSVIIPGKNLFADQQLQIQLRDELGQAHPISIERFADDGSALTINLPVTTRPGYYSLNIQASNSTVTDCQRFSVLRSERQPYILGIDAPADPYNVEAQSFCPDTVSIRFGRTNLTDAGSLHSLTFGTTFFTNVSTFKAWAVLVSAKQTYRLPLQITDQYYGSWYDLKIQTKWFEGRYGINKALTADTYRLFLEYVDQETGKSTISEPYERIIRID